MVYPGYAYSAELCVMLSWEPRDSAGGNAVQKSSLLG